MTGDAIMTGDENVQLMIGCGHVLYANGDMGASMLAEEMAKEYGMQIELWVPPNHPCAKFNSPANVEVLLQGNDSIKRAANHLGRSIPTHFYPLSLLQSNYHIARNSHTVFAFGTLELNRKELKGGTGWTVCMAMDLGKEVFVFDTVTQTWFEVATTYQSGHWLTAETKFVPTNQTPTLHQSSAVIGSKQINQGSRAELRDLFHRTFCTPENLDEVKRELTSFQL